LTTRPRLPDALIASVIFAPSASNCTLSSVTADVGIGEALTLEWMMAQEGDTVDQALRSRWRDVEEVKRFVSALCEQFDAARTRVYGPALTMSTVLRPEVPARTFPFAGHFDLLALPVVEGISFDVDDFVEH